jgi:hypothetical protein
MLVSFATSGLAGGLGGPDGMESHARGDEQIPPACPVFPDDKVVDPERQETGADDGEPNGVTPSALGHVEDANGSRWLPAAS